MAVESGRTWRPPAQEASVVDDILFATGGSHDGFNALTSILSWDPVAESWQPAGDLALARNFHAAVAVPTSLVEC